MYSGLKTARSDGLIGSSILILGFFCLPLAVLPQELFYLWGRVERGKGKLDGWGGRKIREDRESEGGGYVSGFTPSLHM